MRNSKAGLMYILVCDIVVLYYLIFTFPFLIFIFASPLT